MALLVIHETVKPSDDPCAQASPCVPTGCASCAYIQAFFPLGTQLLDLKLFSVEGGQLKPRTLGEVFSEAILENYRIVPTPLPARHRPLMSPNLLAQLMLRSWNPRAEVRVRAEFSYKLPEIVALEGQGNYIVGVGNYRIYGIKVPIGTEIRGVRVWPPELLRFDPYHAYPAGVDLGGVRADFELTEVPGPSGKPNVLQSSLIVRISDPSVVGGYSLGMDVKYPPGYDPVPDHSWVPNLDLALTEGDVGIEVKADVARGLYYSANQICVDSAGRVGAHFDHSPFLQGIPPEIYNQVTTVQASGVPYECKDSSPYLKVGMRVARISTGNPPWVVSFFGTVAKGFENVKADPIDEPAREGKFKGAATAL